MKLVRALLALGLTFTAFSGAQAAGKDKTPNCEVKGKKKHVKDEAACTKAKGTWIATAAAGGTTAPAGETAPANETKAP